MSIENKETKNRGSGAVPHGRQDRTEPAAVALRMEDLTVWVIERASRMPREHKFTVGDKLVETCLEVTTLLVEASFVHDKGALLGQASRALTRARVLARVAHRTGRPELRCSPDGAGATTHSPPRPAGPRLAGSKSAGGVRRRLPVRRAASAPATRARGRRPVFQRSPPSRVHESRPSSAAISARVWP
jgi:hypothetical protein